MSKSSAILDQYCDQIVGSGSDNIGSIQKQILKYECFVEDVLKCDLQLVSNEYEKIMEKIEEYEKIRSTISMIQEKKIHKMKTMSDLGSNCYVKCVIPNTEKIYLDIGLNCLVELTLAEAETFIRQRVSLYQNSLDSLMESSAKIKAHIKIVLNMIDQLRNECLSKKS